MPDPLPNQIQRLIRSEHRIRDEAAACRAAMEFIPKDTAGKDHFYGGVLALTRSPVSAKGGLRGGDVIWIVKIANAAVSEIDPTPEGIYWVKAADGAVFPTAPQS